MMMQGSFFVALLSLGALFFKRHQSPANMVLLAVFTLAESYSVRIIRSVPLDTMPVVAMPLVAMPLVAMPLVAVPLVAMPLRHGPPRSLHTR